MAFCGVELDFEHLRPVTRHRLVERRPEVVPAIDAPELQSVEVSGRPEIQPMWRLELLFERLVCLDGEDVEDAPAVVVHEDDGRVDVTATQREQAVHVVVVRQVAGHQHEGVLGRAPRAQCRRGDAVDTARAPVAQHGEVGTPRPAEPIGVPDRHAVGDEHRRRVRRVLEDVREDATFPVGFCTALRHCLPVDPLGSGEPVAPRLQSGALDPVGEGQRGGVLVGHQQVRRGELRLRPAARRVDDELPAVGVAEVLPEGFGGR